MSQSPTQVLNFYKYVTNIRISRNKHVRNYILTVINYYIKLLSFNSITSTITFQNLL